MARSSIAVCILIIVTLFCRANGIVMDPLGNYILDWHVDSENHVVFDIVVKTNGFVAFGISKDGNVDEAEMLVAQIMDGKIGFKAYHSNGGADISEDKLFSWDIPHASKNSSHISLSLSKTIGSIDAIMDGHDGEMFFTWAYPRSGSNELEYHFHRTEVNSGTMKVDLKMAIIGAGYTAEDKIRAFGPVVLDPFEKFVVNWEVNEGTGNITFTVVVQTTGYVGFGISNDGVKLGSDIVIMTLVNEEIVFKDYHGTTSITPVVDTQQDWTLLSSSRENGYTTLEFTRALDTGDLTEDVAITNDDAYFVWAFPKSGSTVPAYHGTSAEGFRGAYKINILNPVSPTTPPPTAPTDPTITTEPTAEPTDPTPELTTQPTDPTLAPTTEPTAEPTTEPATITAVPTISTGPTTEGPVPTLPLDPFGKYTVEWSVDDIENSVKFTVVVETTGYVGFGISTTGTKSGSDMVVMTIINEEIVFKDYHGTFAPGPVEDAQQDWTLLSSLREDGYTTLTFTRALDTGDSAEDVVIADEDTYFLWAFPKSNSPVFTYHGAAAEGYRGAYKINILNPVPSSY